MKDFISPLIKIIPKPVLFMLVSAVGCFLFALLVEPLLYLMQRSASFPKGSPQSICLTMDVSGSMQGEPLGEVKAAARKFINNRDLSRDKIAIVTFSDSAQIIMEFSNSREELINSIDRLYSFGSTNFEAAMRQSEAVVGRKPSDDHPEEKVRSPGGDLSILLFTDGENTAGNPEMAVQIASSLAEKNVRIFAIATHDADVQYLARLTKNPAHVIFVRSGDFEKAFAQVEEMIYTKTLAGTHQGGFQSALIFIMLLTVFLSCGITFFLVGAQNKFLKKPLFTTKQFLFLLTAAVLAGTISGFIAEIFNTGLRFIYLGAVGSLIGWTVLGSILAFGMVFFIPNLKRDIALKGGALGGFLGAIGFLILSSIFGDTGGRLLGAFILGGCIGAMVGIVEVVSRKVWLAVVYSPRDVTVVNLGPQTVTVGSGNDDTVLVRNVDQSCGSQCSLPAAEFCVDGNIVRYKGADGNRDLEPGARVKYGQVELVVCSQDVPFSPSRFYPLIFSRVMELRKRG